MVKALRMMFWHESYSVLIQLDAHLNFRHRTATEQIKWGRLANLKFKPAFLENICFKFHKTFRVVQRYIVLYARRTMRKTTIWFSYLVSQLRLTTSPGSENQTIGQ